MRRRVLLAAFARAQVLLEQLSSGVPPSEAECDGQSQHQGAEGDGKRGQHDRRGHAQLFERHHDADCDDEQAQRAAQQARARQPGPDVRK